MKIRKTSIVLLLLWACVLVQSNAQTTSASNNLAAQQIPDRTVSFSITDPGVSKPITWGLDLAWLSEENIRRGIAYMGVDRVSVVRASFQPTLPLLNGDLQGTQITDLNTRLNLIDLTGAKTEVILNCDHPSVDASYVGNAANWAALIDATTKRVQARNRTVISVSPFNEPDYGWGQYSSSNGQSDFYNIAGELRKNIRFDNIRISGGNTLNCDQALPWYNYLKTRLNEGNTHQLAGSFDNYAAFFTAVRANGHHATADELHNVMEAIVGVEYGMQTGIWWGTAELARGEFVKASDGVRLGYAEHRPNWTAAAVYRNLDGKVQAFGGTSERQAVTTVYRFVSKDKDVYYDGYGPQREYTMTLPGGTGYQTGQTNAERVVNITWGEDIQPVVNGRYLLVNRMSGKVMAVPLGATATGIALRQYTNTGATYQQWDVTPVDSRIGGDFSYFTLTNVNSNLVADVLNYSLDDAATILQWTNSKGANQQWYLEYSEDGWFYVRSRQSTKCLEVASPYTSEGASIQQRGKNGATNQQWRFIPVTTGVEFVAPNAPTNLIATPNATSVRLDWDANLETDLAGYTIFRADSLGGFYNTIARNVKTASFVDNTTASGKTYYYKIKAIDNALNRSGYSTEATATTTTNKDLVACFRFESNTLDSTINLNHAATYGTVSYTTGKIGSQAISLNGTSTFVQLPATVGNHKELTVATWVYWNGSTSWQRIFDFGNDQTQYMFLTPRSGDGQLRFGIKNGGTEQTLNSTIPMPYLKWTHVAVTLGETSARLYVNGIQIAESSAINATSFGFQPVMNYIGRSQFSDPLFNGRIDDFRVYNYALSANEIAQLSGTASGIENVADSKSTLSISPVPAKNMLYVNYPTPKHTGESVLSIYQINGKLVVSKNILPGNETELDVSNLPDGIYMVKLTNSQENLSQKLIIKH
jgi:fibronectin type 3 domain-containing protein